MPPANQSNLERDTVPTPTSNPIQVVSDFYFQNLFENSRDAVVVLQLQPAITLFTANQRARQWFDWPEDPQSSEFAEQIIELSGLTDEARQLSSLDEVAAVESVSRTHHCKAGVVEWTPFQTDKALYVLITLKLDGDPTGSESLPKTATKIRQADPMNSMAVAYWLKTFIHQVSQPLHVNQNTADIIEIEAEQNLIDSQTIRPRLERMQFAGNLLRECLSDLRKQLQLMSIKFSKINLHDLLSSVASQFQTEHSVALNLQLSAIDGDICVHGNVSLLSEAITGALELLWASSVNDKSRSVSGDSASKLSLSAVRLEGNIQITIASETENSLVFVDFPLMKQMHANLIPAATWGVCESIIETHYGKLQRQRIGESDQIQIGLPEASEQTQQPNVNVTLHCVWPRKSEQ